MFISIATTHRPAVDLGFLLMKHPERVHEVELAFGAFVAGAPLRRTHECVFAILAFECEPIDPRL